MLGPYNFCPLSCPPLHEMSLDSSSFLEEISSLSHSIVFLYFCALFYCSFKTAFLSLLPILWNSALNCVYLSLSPLPFTSIFSAKPTQTTTLPSCISFSLRWFWSLPPVQCYEPPSIILPAVCLLDPNAWIYLSPNLYNYKGFNIGHTWVA